MTPTDVPLETFQNMRPRLFGIAYRMLGSRADAEDVLQEAWMRLETAGGVASVEGFLVTAVTRLCIDHVRSARVRREQYVGPWLPEPLAAGPDDPGRDVERLELLSIALLRVVDRLEPLERAVFLLREVFGYPYDDVAAMVERTPEHCRQIALRARARVRAARPRREASPEDHARLLERFLAAAQEGEVEALERLLVDDAVLVSDSGGKARAARRPIRGRNAVARFMVGVTRKAGATVRTELGFMNGLPAALSYENGRLVQALTVDVGDGGIAEIYVLRNPEKLGGLG